MGKGKKVEVSQTRGVDEGRAFEEAAFKLGKEGGERRIKTAGDALRELQFFGKSFTSLVMHSSQLLQDVPRIPRG